VPRAVLLFLSAIKLVAEIALMCLLGQGVLALLAGERRQQNFFYQLFEMATRPFTRLARWVAPRQVADHHVGFVAFFMLAVIWVLVTLQKVEWCVANNMVGCR
jgi:hypothetical protein